MMKLFTVILVVLVMTISQMPGSQVAALELTSITTISTSGPGVCPTTSKLDTAMANNTEYVKNLIRNNVLPSQPLRSCRDLPQMAPSGEYYINTTVSGVRLLFCDMNRTSCCNTTEGWMRIAYLDMTDPTQQCPPGFRFENRNSTRACGRHTAGCLSTIFPVYGIQYSRVCGKIIGYQFSTTDGLGNHQSSPPQTTVDSVYVDGVSLTHGSGPRKHIWTFVAALDETYSDFHACPCTRTDRTYTGSVPTFIGRDYFCDTGSRTLHQHNTLYNEDPLWDGAGCGPLSTCCSFNNPPWFCKQLARPSTEDVELRLCGFENIQDEDAPLEVIEIYVQ